jgi:hypothetical protein
VDCSRLRRQALEDLREDQIMVVKQDLVLGRVGKQRDPQECSGVTTLALHLLGLK